MKKFLFALCLGMMSLTLSAQQQNGQRPRGPRTLTDAVVDTAIINQMKLEPAMTEQIVALQAAKQTEMRDFMQQNRGNRGQRLSDDERKAMMDRRKEFVASYRAELRKLMGDDLYIAYLERVCDSHRPMGGGQRPQGQGQQRGGLQMNGQRQMGRGGFGGGGAFGDNDF